MVVWPLGRNKIAQGYIRGKGDQAWQSGSREERVEPEMEMNIQVIPL